MTDAERATVMTEIHLLTNAAERSLWGKPLDEMTDKEVREHNRAQAALIAKELDAARAHAARVAAPRPLAKVLEFKPRSA